MKTATKLKRFRQQCERKAGCSAHRIKLPLSHVLADVCQTLKLSRSEKRKVLGRTAVTRLEDVKTWRVSLRKPNRASSKS
jgi:hypothetical protein